MNPLLIVAVILVIAIIGVVAYALYKARFRVDKITAKIPGVVDVQASRAEEETAPDAQDAKLKISQEAEDGGTISKSGITAPAEAKADIAQRAAGEEAEINDSPIELT